ncbi:MAG: hypothetical protein R6U97_02335 [Desulfosalsimonas sp.]
MYRECAGPPWHRRQCWQAANSSVSQIFKKHRGRLDLLIETAGLIRAGLEQLDLLYSDLCAKTCTFCPEPCCVSADIWFDLKDLLFLHAAGLPLPIESPKTHGRMPCAFLGPRGCLLPRTCRPWICTWYLCVTQKRHLQKNNPEQIHHIRKITDKILAGRKNLESGFIEITKA